MLPAHAPSSKHGRSHARARTPKGSLLDFGFIGSTQRFEARTRRSRPTTIPLRAEVGQPSSNGSSTRVRPRREFSAWRTFRMRACFGNVDSCRAISRSWTTASRSEDMSAALARRSIVVLDWRDMPSSAALGVLRLRQLAVREFCVLARRAPSKEIHVMNAAEGRAAYGQRTPAPDPRMAQTIVEVERLLTRGRHAAAERALRGAMAAFERRGDCRRAGDSALRLGRLLLGRGRAADARALFTDAHDRFQRARSCRACDRGDGVSRPCTDRPRTTERG